VKSFSDLNELNLSFQSTFVTVFLAHEKTDANVKKISILGKVCKERNYSVFPYTLWLLCLKWNSPFSHRIASEIADHLKNMQTSIT